MASKVSLLSGYLILVQYISHINAGSQDLCSSCNCGVHYKGELWVNCDTKNLATIPPLPYATADGPLERLSLAYNNISELKDDTFANTSALKILILDNNQIKEIPESLFKNTPALERLDNIVFSLGEASELKCGPHLFTFLRHAQEGLEIFNNKIKKIPSKLFSSTPNITHIKLHANRITTLPENMFDSTPRLTKLDLSGNQLTTISPRLFETLSKLSWLELSKNRIARIPRELFKKTFNLEYLDVENNSIRDIPQDLLVNTRKLRHLNIGYNLIERFPERLLRSTNNLEQLYIHQNRFNDVEPIIFDNTVRLETLSTSGYTDCCNAERITGLKIVCRYSNKKQVDTQGCGVRIIPENRTIGQRHVGNVELYDYETFAWKKLGYHANWSLDDAHVICKNLNFWNAIDSYGVNFFGGKEEVTSDVYKCSGTENYFMDCKKSKCLNNICTTDRVVWVQCRIEGEMLGKICERSTNAIDCSCKNIYNSPPWVNETLVEQYRNIASYDMSHNHIRRIWKGNLAPFPKLKTLDLSYNDIEEVPEDFLFYSSKLQNLSFSRNKIRNFHTAIFHHLKTLDLSYNELTEFNPQLSMLDSQLEYLNLSGNLIKNLGKSMSVFHNLKVLDISEMSRYLDVDDWSFVRKMSKLELMRASKFDQCCFVRSFLKNVVCEAPVNKISNCGSLIKDKTLETILWIIMVVVILANFFGFSFRLVTKEEKNSMKLLILNLMISDFLMGVFLAGILHKHMTTAGEYFTHDKEWRRSLSCKAFGVISFLSSELSLATVTVIAHTRYHSVVNGFAGSQLNGRCFSVLISLTWLVSVCLAAIPAIVDNYIDAPSDFYGGNALCLPLYLPGDKQLVWTWAYSFAIFGCINLLAVCYIMAIYVYIFYKVMYKKTADSTALPRNKEDRCLTIRLFLIVLTDMLCWIPVITLLYVSLAGFVNDEQDVIYTWFVVCVFPLNSTVNPIIYTFMAPRMWSNLRKGLRRFGSSDSATSRERTEMTSCRSTQRIELDNVSISGYLNGNSVYRPPQ